MKLLLDQNLSHRLIARLTAHFPNTTHVRDLGLSRAPDTEIWAHAAIHGFVIVSKDADFQQRALLLGPPPKVIWIRLGNCMAAQVVTVLLSHLAILFAFESDQSASFIAIA